jgi:D-beta-D-heptose 7-phosphate kinase/D-beta-D-heptose 1-phosphate adenosyltransferase
MKKTKRILVVGDLILDGFHHGDYIGQSLSHAKTPVALRRTTNYTWGGAGFLVRNILALGGEVSFISVIGKDNFAELANTFTHQRLKKLFLQITGRPTTVKERFLIGNKRILNWHHLDNSPLSQTQERFILSKIRAELPNVDKVVVSDYRHGLLSKALAGSIVTLCRKAEKPLYVDSQISYAHAENHTWYKGASLFCLNRKEAKSIDARFIVGKPISFIRLQKLLQTANIVVKLGDEGSVAQLGGDYIETKAHKIKEIDAVGAGDAFMAALSLGDTPPTRSDLETANVWAALSATKIGTEAPSLSEFKKVIGNRGR